MGKGRTALASVMTGPWKSELREVPVAPIEDDAGLLQIDAAGICGADVHYYGENDVGERILGHENVGTVVELGRRAAERWGLSEGDRVVLEEYLPCGVCRYCRSAEFRLCLASDPRSPQFRERYGSTPLTRPPRLWGGFSQLLHLAPNAVIHRAPKSADPVELALTLPLANGYEWTCLAGGMKPGWVVLVIGPGQQGLGCVAAAATAGAGKVIVVGRQGDEHRLRAAKGLGATDCGVVEDQELMAALEELEGQVDLVVDTSGGSDESIRMALEMVSKGGTWVLCAAGRDVRCEGALSLLQSKYLTVRGVRGHSYVAVEWAIATISADPARFEELCTHRVGLDHVHLGIEAIAGLGDDKAIHAVVVPEHDGS